MVPSAPSPRLLGVPATLDRGDGVGPQRRRLDTSTSTLLRVKLKLPGLFCAVLIWDNGNKHLVTKLPF